VSLGGWLASDISNNNVESNDLNNARHADDLGHKQAAGYQKDIQRSEW